MSVQSVKVHFPSSLAQPRGAVWAQGLSDRLAHAGRVVWRELEATGQARANRELQRMAQLHAHDPKFAQALLSAMHPSSPSSQRG